MNILIVKLSAIGDVIHTLPALNAIRQHYPDARITWIVEEAAADIVLGHSALDRVIISSRKQWIKRLRSKPDASLFAEIRSFFKALRDTRYDLILDFQALLKSGILIALARGGRKIGFGSGMEHMEHSTVFLNERIPPVSMETHALTRNLMMLESIGIKDKGVVYNIPIGEEDYAMARGMLTRHGIMSNRPLVAINPVAKWPTKLWEIHRFSQLADRVCQGLEAQVFFTGGDGDKDLVEAIITGMQTRAVNFAGNTTLKVLAALYEMSELLISTDTGPMHLGAAVGIPVVALFGPTAPWRTGPYGRRHKVIRRQMTCGPCFKRNCRTLECMAQINVDEVYRAVEVSLMESVPKKKNISAKQVGNEW